VIGEFLEVLEWLVGYVVFVCLLWLPVGALCGVFLCVFGGKSEELSCLVKRGGGVGQILAQTISVGGIVEGMFLDCSCGVPWCWLVVFLVVFSWCGLCVWLGVFSWCSLKGMVGKAGQSRRRETEREL
jgi:hypothetical protein